MVVANAAFVNALRVTLANFLVHNRAVIYMIMKFRPTRGRHKNQSIVQAKSINIILRLAEGQKIARKLFTKQSLYAKFVVLLIQTLTAVPRWVWGWGSYHGCFCCAGRVTLGNPFIREFYHVGSRWHASVQTIMANTVHVAAPARQ